MPRKSRIRFSSLELAKVFIEEEYLSKLSAFFRFCSDKFISRHIFAHETQILRTFFGYSIVKHRKNEKGTVTFKFSLEKLALPLP